MVGRTSDEVILLDDAFERDGRRVAISISDKPVDVFVPSYRDYFILKAVSGRRSDVRDIASLVWKLGVPDVKPRLRQILPHPEVFQRKIKEVIIPDLEDARFVHSWRGTFVTEEFSDADRLGVVKLLKELP